MDNISLKRYLLSFLDTNIWREYTVDRGRKEIGDTMNLPQNEAWRCLVIGGSPVFESQSNDHTGQIPRAASDPTSSKKTCSPLFNKAHSRSPIACRINQNE